MRFSHELIVPEEGLPFKLFLFEGRDGYYCRDKHWHPTVEIFAVCRGIWGSSLTISNGICRRISS